MKKIQSLDVLHLSPQKKTLIEFTTDSVIRISRERVENILRNDLGIVEGFCSVVPMPSDT